MKFSAILLSLFLVGSHGQSTDTTAPTITGRFTQSGDVIDYDQSYEMIAEVTDDTAVRSVRFEVIPPSGGRVVYVADQSPGTNIFTADVFFDEDGTYTSSVIARDRSGNVASSDSIIFSVEGAEPEATTAAEVLAQIDPLIRETIEESSSIAATYVRLGFHDCVPNGDDLGGCDGCLNLASNPANNGLSPAVEALAPIVTTYENTALGVSRADIWAYAALIGAEESQKDLPFIDNFRAGRANCETRGTCSGTDPVFCASNGPDEEVDFPSPDLTTHELLDFFDDHFGYTADQTVAIMGAHSLGKTSRGNSGFDGENGWVSNEFRLANDYYRLLVGGDEFNDEDTDVETLALGPNWNVINIENTGIVDENGIDIPDRFQWDRAAGDGSSLIMLNADIAIVRDLGTGELLDSGEPTCTFRNPVRNRCPLAETLTKAGIYRANNLEFLQDFKAAFEIMLDKNL